jgi:hypothetical protein
MQETHAEMFWCPWFESGTVGLKVALRQCEATAISITAV